MPPTTTQNIQSISGITSNQARKAVGDISDRMNSIQAARAINLAQRQQGLAQAQVARGEIGEQFEEGASDFERRLRRIQEGEYDLSSAEKAQLNRVTEQYKRLERNQQFVNRNLEVGQQGVERGLGTSRFAPELAASNVGQEVSKGIERIEVLNDEREEALENLRQSFIDNRIDSIMEEYNIFESKTKERKEAIKEQEKSIKEQADSIEDIVRRQESFTTTDQKNYMEAKRQGFTGTLMDFKRTYGKQPKSVTGKQRVDSRIRQMTNVLLTDPNLSSIAQSLDARGVSMDLDALDVISEQLDSIEREMPLLTPQQKVDFFTRSIVGEELGLNADEAATLATQFFIEQEEPMTREELLRRRTLNRQLREQELGMSLPR
jgi:hypothetical protein